MSAPTAGAPTAGAPTAGAPKPTSTIVASSATSSGPCVIDSENPGSSAPRSYLFGAVVVAGAAALSGLAVRGRVARLDLVAVLETRE